MDKRSSELCSVFSTDAGFVTFRIVEVVYNDYIIFHLINFNNKQTFEMLILLGRVYLFSFWGGETGGERKPEQSSPPNCILGLLSSSEERGSPWVIPQAH